MAYKIGILDLRSPGSLFYTLQPASHTRAQAEDQSINNITQTLIRVDYAIHLLLEFVML